MTAIGDSTPTKTCTKCGECKPATAEFFTAQKLGKYGFTSVCKICRKHESAKAYVENKIAINARNAAYRADHKEAAAAYAANWRQENKSRIAEVKRAYREKNRDLLNAAAVDYRSRNIEKCRAYVNKHYASNSKKINDAKRVYRAANFSKVQAAALRYRTANGDTLRRKERERRRERYESDVAYNLKARFSSRIRKMLQAYGGKSGKRTDEILGYTSCELRDHLERQFTKGMTWEALISGQIHVDHIRPIASFQYESTECAGFKECWALANLRPLWAKDNLSKGAQITHLI